ncbi:MAG: hypothetical protein RIR09_1241 [Pseudomonadota bacterium]
MSWDLYDKQVDFSELVGCTLSAITGAKGDDSIVFECVDGSKYQMYHSQDCCESVSVDDIEGDLSDLIGLPITLAEESSNSDPLPDQDVGEYCESFTWTFYRIATARGFVVIRWFGESNGYYSESVSFAKIN